MDYFSNTLERTYPRGLDVEIFTFTVLKRAFFEAHEFYQREHVTPYIYQSPDAFVICGSKRNKDLSRLRWTLDTYEDLKFINTIYEYLYKNDELFYTRDILELLDIHPEIIKINENVFQKELANPK